MEFDKELAKKRLSEKITITPGCWVWDGCTDRKGYGKIMFARFNYYAHRLSYLAYVGEIPEGKLVCHTCDNPRCINPEHLFAGTPMDNSTDMINKGRQYHPFGEDNGQAKLTESDVISIRRLRAKGWKYREIAERFGVHQTTVLSVVTRECWKHVVDPVPQQEGSEAGNG